MLALDIEALPSKVLKPKNNLKVDKKHSKKTNLSVALFDKDNSTEIICSEAHPPKEGRENK